MKPTHIETNPKAIIEICDAIAAITHKYHGHKNASTCADLAVVSGLLMLLSGSPGNRTAERVDAYKEGVCRVIDGYKTGEWLTDDPVIAGLPTPHPTTQ